VIAGCSESTEEFTYNNNNKMAVPVHLTYALFRRKSRR